MSGNNLMRRVSTGLPNPATSPAISVVRSSETGTYNLELIRNTCRTGASADSGEQRHKGHRPQRLAIDPLLLTCEANELLLALRTYWNDQPSTHLQLLQ